eukprot:CAMPEP_0117490084 /NCGR_PEP_ID=MMETSP0784-20121206/17369_1 /TAXON_ID=39447 /ORGANISM="" /LENGTH=422 /DNA_ID=CAMNT_0005284833 /DNA_START=65 /DNA_END=1330 /DNA_ORIENTATION=-
MAMTEDPFLSKADFLDGEPPHAYSEAMREHYGVEDTTWTFSNAFCLKDFSIDELQKFAPRILVAVVLHIVCLYINNLSQAWLQANMADYYQKRWPPNRMLVADGKMFANETVVLWDLVFENLPYMDGTAYADFYAGALPLVTFFRFVVVPGPFSMRWTVFCRYLTCWGLLWLCRAFTILVTPLPNPDLTCKPSVTFPNNIWLEAWAFLPIDPRYWERTCQDVLFSGHTAVITLSVLFFFKYSAAAPWFESTVDASACCSRVTVINIVGCAVLLSGYYFIIASRFHYTIDVLIGAMMTFMVVQGYHYAIRVVWLPSQPRFRPHNAILRWYELHAKDLNLFHLTLAVRRRIRIHGGRLRLLQQGHRDQHRRVRRASQWVLLHNREPFPLHDRCLDRCHDDFHGRTGLPLRHPRGVASFAASIPT